LFDPSRYPRALEAVSAVLANIGPAIASYERTIPPPETQVDRRAAAENLPEPGLLSEDEIAGLRLFLGEGECDAMARC
jgi:cytochrome c peroxidase